jgi:hypothetical protein
MTGPFRHYCAGIVRGTSTVSPFGLRSGRAELVYRGRLELVSAPLPQQAYHAAAEGELSLSQAEDLVRRWLDGATANARDGLRKVASAAV